LIQSLSAVIIIPYNKHIYRIGISVFTKVQRIVSILGACIVTLLGIIAFFLLPLVFTIDLPPYYYIIGAFFAFPSFVYVPIIFLFYRIKKEREIMWVNYIGAAINLALTFFFVLKGDPMNAILGSAIGQWAILAWYMYRKNTVVNAIKMS
jgi:O-antigen/teichoic acid export membrane protein